MTSVAVDTYRSGVDWTCVDLLTESGSILIMRSIARKRQLSICYTVVAIAADAQGFNFVSRLLIDVLFCRATDRQQSSIAGAVNLGEPRLAFPIHFFDYC